MNPLSRLNPTSKSALMFSAVLACSMVLALTGHLSGAEWAGFVQVTLPAFVVGETARKFAKKEEG